MQRQWKFAIYGFIFGTVGFFVLSALSLAFQVFEYISAPLMYPGRMLSGVIAGNNGTTFDIALITLFNGLLYALVFVGLSKLFKK